MNQHISGAIVLAATSPTKPIYLFADQPTGSHVEGRARGTWWTATEGEVWQREVPVPHRDKFYRMDCAAQTSQVLDSIATSLSAMDPQGHGENDLVEVDTAPRLTLQYKVQQIIRSTEGEFVACCNNTRGHGYIVLMSKQRPLHLFGLVDREDQSVLLVWTTHADFERRLRYNHPLRFLVYRFPQLVDSSLFLSTQALVSRWWQWSNSAVFRNKVAGLMMFNTLEVRLFKDV